jgi:hypothetical protein
MAQELTTQKMIELRQLTRAVSEALRGELAEHLATLLPLVRPRILLGSYVQGAPRDARGSDKAFKELQTAYESVASSKPFNLPRDLKPPIPADSSALEILPFEYEHAAKSKRVTKTVHITSPLKWVLAFSGFSTERLQEALRSVDPGVSVAEIVLHTLVLHVALQQRGVRELFAALRFPLSTHHEPGLGNLPVTVVSAVAPTLRPPDETIIESTEISGTDAFEEVVDLEAIERLQDPVRDRLNALVRDHRDRLNRETRERGVT